MGRNAVSREDAVGNTGWQTPQATFDELQREFGPFDLDPAGAHNAYVSHNIGRYCTEDGTWFRSIDPWGPPDFINAEDGLTVPWRGRVFVNPPYRNVEPWVRKGRIASRAGALVVMLLLPSTDAKWFHRYVWDKRLHRPREGVEARFLEGRIRFVHPDPAKRVTDFKGYRPLGGNMLVVFHPETRP